MRRLQTFKPVWVLYLVSFSLFFHVGQQTTADTGHTSMNPIVDQQLGAGHSSPQNPNLGHSDNSNSANNKVIYVVERIDPIAAKLSSKNPTSRINVRSQPSTRSEANYFGYKGDPVTLLKKADKEKASVWYYLRFDQSRVEGWVREDFIVMSPTKLRPKQEYLPSNLDTDPWVSSFNKSYASAKQTNEPWLFQPTTVALKLLGYPNTDGCKPTEVSTIGQSAHQVTVIISNGPGQGELCSDDSILAAETRVDLVKQDQTWAIEWVGGRYRCHQGRGQQDFAPARCS